MAGKDVRGRLAEDASEDYQIIREALREGAQATKKVWADFTCKHCDRKQKHQVEVPDAQAAARAAQVWLEQGFGKAAQAKDETSLEDLVKKDPLRMTPIERAQLRVHVEHLIAKSTKPEGVTQPAGTFPKAQRGDGLIAKEEAK